ncbi:MAG: PD-(D/E)XK nuclease family protein [Candidatus Omnitrophica bacterium]|nr:PD-(D/E)XK nuclease family protein [Candidatus Omnitrophota bacterium]MCM8803342.1 PD-(D/E)XK nuclease family protein [Candidatus Omnitrophota bacterium]
MNREKTGLSAHSLNIFRECERCFYLQVKHNISRPRGPMPSIATGIDSLIKEYFEYFRKKGKLPPFLEKEIKDGKLMTNLKKTYYYEIKNNKNYYLWGHLDEVIQLPNELYIPLDHKTRASLPTGEPHDAYKFQLSIYSLLLTKENNGNEVEFGYLIYYYPEKELIDYNSNEIKNIINFSFEVKKVDLDINKTKQIIEDAIRCLKSDKLPKTGENCEYCKWIEKTKIYYIENSIKEEKNEKVEIKIVEKENEEYKETLF